LPPSLAEAPVKMPRSAWTQEVDLRPFKETF
jgi:hypothetical protein